MIIWQPLVKIELVEFFYPAKFFGSVVPNLGYTVKLSTIYPLHMTLYGTQLEGPLRNLWFPTPDRATAYETSFIVVGPIPNDNPGHLTTGLHNNSCS